MTLRQAQAYWLTVADCLIEFYGVGQDEANSRVNSILGRLREEADFHPTKDLIYHAEPIHIAAEEMGREIERNEEFYKQYRLLEQRNQKMMKRRSTKRQDISSLQISIASEAA